MTSITFNSRKFTTAGAFQVNTAVTGKKMCTQTSQLDSMQRIEQSSVSSKNRNRATFATHDSSSSLQHVVEEEEDIADAATKSIPKSSAVNGTFGFTIVAAVEPVRIFLFFFHKTSSSIQH